MKKADLIALVTFIALLGLSACKSTEMAQDAAPPATQSSTMPTAETTNRTQSVAASDAVNVDDLIAKYVEARGGRDNIKAVESIKMTGNLEVMGMDVELTNFVKRPNKTRTYLAIKSMNMEVNQGFDGEMGWMQQPGSDPQPMPSELTRHMADQADIDGLLMDYKERGYALEYLGEDTVEGNPAYKMKLIRPDRDDATIYLDAKTYLEVKIDAEGIHPQTGQPAKTETIMSDFRSVDGIQMPHALEIRMDGATFQKLTMSKIELNVDVKDSIFSMPGMRVDVR